MIFLARFLVRMPNVMLISIGQNGYWLKREMNAFLSRKKGFSRYEYLQKVFFFLFFFFSFFFKVNYNN